MKKGVGGFYLGDLSSYTGDVYMRVLVSYSDLSANQSVNEYTLQIGGIEFWVCSILPLCMETLIRIKNKLIFLYTSFSLSLSKCPFWQ